MLCCRGFQPRFQRRERIVGRDQYFEVSGFVGHARPEKALQRPAGILRPAPVDEIGGILRPIGTRVSVGDRQAAALIQLAIEDLPLFAEVGRGSVGIDCAALPTAPVRVATLVD